MAIAGDVLDNFIGAFLYSSNWSIGEVFPDVVVEASHEDRLAVTVHPVEGGGAVSDHAWVMPRSVDIRLGFADSKAGFIGASVEQYHRLLEIQAAREPIDVSTSKRSYQNMLPVAITEVTDSKTKYTCMIIVRCQEIRITNAQQAGQGDMRFPQSNMSQQNLGLQQAQVANPGIKFGAV